MTANFRKVFCPTKAEQIQSMSYLIALHKENVGYCVTCANYMPSDLPGFVADYGECLAKNPIFAQRVCGLSNETCEQYVEDRYIISKIETLLDKLKGELNE